ncbi:hypothetical protein BH10ACI4_BH10ACI4_07150 [soil metagenome]
MSLSNLQKSIASQRVRSWTGQPLLRQLIGQTSKRIPSRIGRSLIAIALSYVQILAAARAQTFAVRLTESASRQGKQHLLTHYILKQKPALSIIPYFGLILGNGSLSRFGVRTLRPEQQVKPSRYGDIHRLDATRAQHLELCRIVCADPDIVDVVVRSAMLYHQVRLPLYGQRPYLPQVCSELQYPRRNRLIKQQGLINKLDRCNQHSLSLWSRDPQVKYADRSVDPASGSFELS